MTKTKINKTKIKFSKKRPINCKNKNYWNCSNDCHWNWGINSNFGQCKPKFLKENITNCTNNNYENCTYPCLWDGSKITGNCIVDRTKLHNQTLTELKKIDSQINDFKDYLNHLFSIKTHKLLTLREERTILLNKIKELANQDKKISTEKYENIDNQIKKRKSLRKEHRNLTEELENIEFIIESFKK